MSAVKGKYTSHNKRPDWPRDKRKDHWLGGGNRRAVVPLLSLRFFDDWIVEEKVLTASQHFMPQLETF